jgi:hypothetical protein
VVGDLGADRVFASGTSLTPRESWPANFATPWRALAVLDGSVARYRLFALSAQAGTAAIEAIRARGACDRAGQPAGS